MNRTEKQQEIDRLHEEFMEARNAYLVGFTGMKVSRVTDLRRKIREASGRYRVVKNRLAIRAAEGTPLAGRAELFDGPTAVAYSPTDPVGLAKILSEFSKEPTIKVKGLVIEGRPLPSEALEGIATLPGRPELVAQFAGMLRSPLVKFVMLLKAPVRDFASVLSQLAEKKKSA